MSYPHADVVGRGGPLQSNAVVAGARYAETGRGRGGARIGTPAFGNHAGTGPVHDVSAVAVAGVLDAQDDVLAIADVDVDVSHAGPGFGAQHAAGVPQGTDVRSAIDNKLDGSGGVCRSIESDVAQ